MNNAAAEPGSRCRVTVKRSPRTGSPEEVIPGSRSRPPQPVDTRATPPPALRASKSVPNTSSVANVASERPTGVTSPASSIAAMPPVSNPAPPPLRRACPSTKASAVSPITTAACTSELPSPVAPSS